ncbi:MAG: hypothetical protein DRH12_01435 [Deltaproteobacteria bacterium]|nr:MAG: hypothetical protein DRH12_01435 [Deltaproteobacteria bacterium]
MGGENSAAMGELCGFGSKILVRYCNIYGKLVQKSTRTCRIPWKKGALYVSCREDAPIPKLMKLQKKSRRDELGQGGRTGC